MDIMPNKYVPFDFSLLGVAAILVEELRPNDTVSTLWNRVCGDSRVRSFDRFADGLTVLYSAGAINLRSGVLVKFGEHEG